MIASRSSISHVAPKAQIISYSGPSPLPAYFSVVTAVGLPQAIGQAKQARFLTRSVSARVSPDIFSALSKTPVWKFRVGNAPCWLTTFTKTGVPYVGRPSDVTGCSLIFLNEAAIASLNAFISAILTSPVPRTTTAFRFFEPMTAPTPERPAALPLSFITHANNT